jgi:hypothetical protein
MENSEHVYLRNVDPGTPGILVANLLRPLQLAPNASMSLSTLNVSMSQGVTIEDDEVIGAGYGNVEGALNRLNLSVYPTPGTYTATEFANQVEMALNRISALYTTSNYDQTNNLNRNAALGATTWVVSQATSGKNAYTILSSTGVAGTLTTPGSFTDLTNCTAPSPGTLQAVAPGIMYATYGVDLSAAGALWHTVPSFTNDAFQLITGTTMTIYNGVETLITVNVVPDLSAADEYQIFVAIRGDIIVDETVNVGGGNSLAIGLIRERGGYVVAWQSSAAYSIDVTAGILYDSRVASGATLAAEATPLDWRVGTRVEFFGEAIGTAADAIISNIWVTPAPARPLLGAVAAFARSFAPGGLSDELGFVGDGYSSDANGPFINKNYTFVGPSQTLTSDTPTRNDSINGALIITSDDIPASGRIADGSGSARERALIDFVTATAGLNGEATYEQAYPRHCYIKNRDVLSLQQMSIRLLDSSGADSDRVRSGGSAMLTFHNVVR